jgi:hypothetical protein
VATLTIPAAARAKPAPVAPASTRPALALLVAALVLGGFAVLGIRWNRPLIGMHSFRQTQTAITTYWMLRGGPWLAYQTPVVGPPWSIPYEFPLYQLCVAAMVWMTGMMLDAAGRLLSYICLLLTIFPVRSLARSYRLSANTPIVFAVLLLASPIYLFWGTAFLIETMALLCGFAFLAATAHAARTGDQRTIALGAICGCLAALCKITTFVPFYGLAGLILLDALLRTPRELHASAPRVIECGAAIMIPPPLLFWNWDRFADAQKLRNPIGRFMASTAPLMHAWNFGTWSQVFSRAMIATLMRSLSDTLGIAALAILIVLIVVTVYLRILQRKEMILIVSGAGAFLLPYVIFPNLHIIHNYYDAANAIFLLCTVAIVLGRVFAGGRHRLAWGCLLLILGSQLIWFRARFLAEIMNPSGVGLIAIAEKIKSNTLPDTTIMIYGDEWSPVIPYYAERRALMEPSFVPRVETLARLQSALSVLGRSDVGAIVRCASPLDQDPEFGRSFATIAQTYPQQRIGGCDLYIVNPRPRP